VGLSRLISTVLVAEETMVVRLLAMCLHLDVCFVCLCHAEWVNDSKSVTVNSQ